MFACLYYKKDRSKYDACKTMAFQKVLDVLQHTLDVHLGDLNEEQRKRITEGILKIQGTTTADTTGGSG
jgi:hypothetical protein